MGYATGHFGKWHLYTKNGKGGGGALPSQQGFDVTYDSFGDGKLPEGAKGNKPGPRSDPKGVFDLSKQACDFMEVNKDKPFFVYLAHHAPHGPVNSRNSTREKIKNPYEACVYDLDESVNRVLEKIKDLEIEKQTLVIYTSDNGGCVKTQKPLRGEKGMYYEGGIRVPMIALWPGVIESGSVCEEPVMQIDLFPTYLELAKAKIEKELDGENLLLCSSKPGVLSESRFTGICQVIWTEPNLAQGIKTSAHDRLVSFEKEDGNFISTMKSGYLMAEEKKLIPIDAVELYNLDNDISEQNNVSFEKKGY